MMGLYIYSWWHKIFYSVCFKNSICAPLESPRRYFKNKLQILRHFMLLRSITNNKFTILSYNIRFEFKIPTGKFWIISKINSKLEKKIYNFRNFSTPIQLFRIFQNVNWAQPDGNRIQTATSHAPPTFISLTLIGQLKPTHQNSIYFATTSTLRI